MISVRFDGVAISLASLNEDIPLGFESNLMRLAGVAGAFDADGDEQRREPITIRRGFEIVEASYAAVGVTLAALKAKANRGKRWLEVDERDGTTLGTWAKLKRVSATEQPGLLQSLPVDLTFEISWPWFEDTSDIWYLDTGEVLDDGLFLDRNFTQQVGAGSFTIDNTGDDRIIRGSLVVLGPSTNPRIENSTTDEFVLYTGSVGSGESLVYDLGAVRVGLSGLNVWDGVSMGDFQTRFFSLVVGENDIVFSGGGTLEVHWARVK
jgi:hypothetical protein